MLEFIQENKLQPVWFLNTHAHLDHVFGIAFLKKYFPVPFIIHEKDKPVFDAVPAVSLRYGVACDAPPQPDLMIDENYHLTFDNQRIKILHTPGHSPGSMSFYFEKEKMLISGDTLFQQSIGRSDFEGGNHSQLIQSITEKLFSLPDETKVYSGHGDVTTIGEEKNFNPFVGKNK